MRAALLLLVLLQDPQTKLSGHSKDVYALAFSPNGKILASGSEDQTVKLWDVETGKELRTLSGHTNSIYSVAFDPEGKLVASASLDQTIKLWDVESGKEVRTLSGHTDIVTAVAFYSGGKVLASASADKTVKLWNMETGNVLRTMSGHTGVVTCVAFLGAQVVSGSEDGSVRIWDAGTGKETQTLTADDEVVSSVAVHPNGKSLVTGSRARILIFWDLETGKQVRKYTGGERALTAVFDPDGKWLAVPGGENSVQILDAATGKDAGTFDGHTDPIVTLAVQPGGKVLASGGADKAIRLWKLSSLEPARLVVHHILIAFKGSSKAPATVTRTKEEAEKLAKELLERVKKGEEIAKLAKEFSTDPGAGKYTLVNTGRPAANGETNREQFIKPFTAVAFSLKVGEAGIANYDATECPYGFHVIKRLE